MMRTLLLSLFLWSIASALAVSPAAAQARATPDPDDDPPRVGVLFDPLSIYSSTYGFGMRVMGSLYHVPLPGSRLRLTAWPSQRRQLVMLEFETPDPRSDPIFLMAHLLLERNREHVFYGVGPYSSKENRFEIDRNGLEAEIALGLQRPERRGLLEPFAGFVSQDVLDIFPRPDLPDNSELIERGPLLSALYPWLQQGNTPPERGLTYGLRAEWDARDRPTDPMRGWIFQTRLEAYASVRDHGQPLDFVTWSNLLAGFIPLGRDHRLALRIAGFVTDVRGTRQIPFFLLPTLDWRLLPGYRRNRFLGTDGLVAQAEYRFPLFRMSDLYQVSGIVQVGAGNVYDDLRSQFDLSVSFKEDVYGVGGGIPLRPSLGVGVRVASFVKERDLLYWIVGFSPEGFRPFSPLTFSFVHKFRSPAPFFR